MRSARGFSVMELMVALALLAGLMGVAVPYLSGVMGTSLREHTRHLAGQVRYLYDRASMTGHSYRLAFNLDRHTWWVEENQANQEPGTEQAAVLYTDARARLEGEEALAKLKEEVEAARSRSMGGEGAIPLADRVSSTFSRVESDDMSPVVLEDNVFLLGVWTAQYEEVQRPHETPPEDEADDHIAYVHLFQGGYAERAFIYIGDGEEDVYTLEVEPLTGRVIIYDEEIEVPREFIRK